jgi:hypothetical protein
MRKIGIIAVLSLMVLALAAVPALAARPHEVTNNPITCTLNDNNTVTCSGSVAGLGNQPVRAVVDVAFACETRSGSNQPGGHIQAKSGLITPTNGRINFRLTTGPATCPPGLNPVVGDTATVSIFSAGGTLLFRKTVDIT